MRYLAIILFITIEILALSCKNNTGNSHIKHPGILRDSIEINWIKDSCACYGFRTVTVADRIIQNRSLEGKDTSLFINYLGKYYEMHISGDYIFLTYILKNGCREGRPVDGYDKTYIVFVFYNNRLSSEASYLKQE
ncbi:MAG: hypothetical protein IKX26_03385 [Bacteroidales bacterium]|nr:hypothetical protein [Bacteroidales bacterium]